jgi:glycosyltransferase involved in cell wall biosynthesis
MGSAGPSAGCAKMKHTAEGDGQTDRAMHVLYHHRTSGDGVEGVHIMGIVRALRELGCTVDIASPPGCSPENRKATEAQGGGLRRRLKRFARRAPPVLFELAELAYNACALAQMLRLARHRRPDLIYERTTSNSVAPTLLAGWLGVPIVQEVNVTAQAGRFRKLVLRRLTLAIERWVARRAALVVTVSHAFKAMLVRAHWPADRIIVCPNAISPDEFAPDAVEPAARPPHVQPDDLVVGYVGSFLPYHGLDVLVDIARQMAAGRPRVCWLLVGDGVERRRLEGLIDRHGLRSRFWLPGKVPHEDVPRYVAAMDVAVLPHSAAFNSPMKLFEYMGMARAIAAPRVPAIEEVLTDGKNGLLFQPGEADSCRQALERLVGDSALRARLGGNARECVLANHTWPRNGRRLLRAVARLNRRAGKAMNA